MPTTYPVYVWILAHHYVGPGLDTTDGHNNYPTARTMFDVAEAVAERELKTTLFLDSVTIRLLADDCTTYDFDTSSMCGGLSTDWAWLQWKLADEGHDDWIEFGYHGEEEHLKGPHIVADPSPPGVTNDEDWLGGFDAVAGAEWGTLEREDLKVFLEGGSDGDVPDGGIHVQRDSSFGLWEMPIEGGPLEVVPDEMGAAITVGVVHDLEAPNAALAISNALDSEDGEGDDPLVFQGSTLLSGHWALGRDGTGWLSCAPEDEAASLGDPSCDPEAATSSELVWHMGHLLIKARWDLSRQTSDDAEGSSETEYEDSLEDGPKAHHRSLAEIEADFTDTRPVLMPYHLNLAVEDGMTHLEAELDALDSWLETDDLGCTVFPSEMTSLVDDSRPSSLTMAQVDDLASSIVTPMATGGVPPTAAFAASETWSLAEAYDILARALGDYTTGGTGFPSTVDAPSATVYGPIGPFDPSPPFDPWTHVPSAEDVDPDVSDVLALAVSGDFDVVSGPGDRPLRVPFAVDLDASDTAHAGESLWMLANAVVKLYDDGDSALSATIPIPATALFPRYAETMDAMLEDADTQPFWYGKLQLWTVRPAPYTATACP